MNISQLKNEILRLKVERMQWFLVAANLKDAMLGAADRDEAFDNYLRMRGKLEDPRDFS